MDVCIAGKKPKLKLSLKLTLSLNLATRPQPKGNHGKSGGNHAQACAAAENVYRCLQFEFSFLPNIEVDYFKCLVSVSIRLEFDPKRLIKGGKKKKIKTADDDLLSVVHYSILGGVFRTCIVLTLTV